jgi:hypothetical protein
MTRTLFTKGDSNPKTSKSDKSGKGFRTMILHLAPADLSGHEVCQWRSKGCTLGCLNKAGRGQMDSVQLARIARTKFFFENPIEFKAQTVKELNTFVKSCNKNGYIPATRMNGTSDIVWETVWPELFTMFPMVQFYDYSKGYKRCLPGYVLPDNYHLTFSRAENNDKKVLEVLQYGKTNVAAVFLKKDFETFPEIWNGYPTYSADDDDLRFLDPKGGHIGCLWAKGKAKKDTSGFVIRKAANVV